MSLKCRTPTNTQRCSGLEICLESSNRPIELATWHNCNASQDLSRAAASNQKMSQIKLGLCAGCRAATIVEKALPTSCPNAFDESWRGLPCLSKSTLTSLSWTAGSGHGVKTMPGGNTPSHPIWTLWRAPWVVPYGRVSIDCYRGALGWLQTCTNMGLRRHLYVTVVPH